LPFFYRQHANQKVKSLHSHQNNDGQIYQLLLVSQTWLAWHGSDPSDDRKQQSLEIHTKVRFNLLDHETQHLFGAGYTPIQSVSFMILSVLVSAAKAADKSIYFSAMSSRFPMHEPIQG